MNEVQARATTPLAMWDDNEKVEEIRKLFAPKLSESEFQMFLGMGKATGLNPFTREIWAVKYSSSPAQIFIGRDGYRKAAQAHTEYDYHQADAVYENDKFEVVNGDVNHGYSLANRGRLVGAYCIAKRHKSSRPMYVFAELSEYTTGQSVWKSKPATMIKKVAESQCLRACFQDLLGGTYGAEEMDNNNAVASNSRADELKNQLKEKMRAPIDITPTDETGEVAEPAQVKEIHKLMSEKAFKGERLTKALSHYGADTLSQLTAMQAQDFIEKLIKTNKES